ncbi:MAG: hypothetical protein KGI06_06120 [Candidatus Micrarchaeota archaeon]|nr:hypothetical protein [Candidatus Micrarchaeota archaeon]
MRWQVIKLPFEAGESDFYGRKEGSILWENRYTDDEIAELKSDPATFSALYQQEPQPFEGGWFSEEWLNFYDFSKLDSNRLNRYILVDPALSKKSTGNYTAIIVVGLGEDRNYYVLHMFRDRVDPYERADALFRLVRQWRPIRVGFEQYGLLSDVSYLKERMEQGNFRFTIQELGKTGIGHNLSKKDRVRQLIPTFREGRIWLPKEQAFEDSLGNETDLVRVFVEQEYKRFPSTANDDLIDALARIHDPAMKMEWPEPEEDYEPETVISGSWVVG